MAGSENFYGGSNTGMDSEYGNPINKYVAASQISLALDPRTANQLKDASAKVSSGAKAIEIQLTFPQVAESIPNQHLEELNRLRKLVGVDLTVHGPLVDPTGVGEGNWDETKREQAERQMWSAVERAHKLDPKGNIVVTFHTSNGLPEPETKIFNPDTKEQETTRIAVINQRTGQINQLATPRKEFLLAENGKNRPEAIAELNRINKDQWLQSLAQLNIEVGRAKEAFTIGLRDKEDEMEELKSSNYLDLYEKYKKDPKEYRKIIERVKEEHPKIAEPALKQRMELLARGDIYVRDAFNQFKEIYNQAYEAAENQKKRDVQEKLKSIGDNIRKEIDKEKGYITDYKKLVDFADILSESIESMSSLDAPQAYMPLKEFAIEKASETFSNIAVNAYNKFKGSSPVISIENPPVGMGISRADDMKELIKESRNKFVEKLKKEGVSEDTARNQAEKLIGATWDVGHINMLRKHGFGEKEVVEETKKIAEYVKHIHLSDNFGLDHTELPMGMGNVPMQKHLAELKGAFGDKLKQVKQVVEVGNWYQHFQSSPFAETLSAFGSPIYAMHLGPSWNKAMQSQAGYFAGYGMNPDIHHSLYGSGFSTLPVELGGQIQGRSRLSGAPIE